MRIGDNLHKERKASTCIREVQVVLLFTLSLIATVVMAREREGKMKERRNKQQSVSCKSYIELSPVEAVSLNIYKYIFLFHAGVFVQMQVKCT